MARDYHRCHLVSGEGGHALKPVISGPDGNSNTRMKPSRVTVASFVPSGEKEKS